MIPTTAARDLLGKYWNGQLPVDPVRFAKALGVEVLSSPALSESGCYRIDEGRPTIRFNPNEPLRRQRFTIAHELGHHVLRHGNSFRDPAQNFSIAYFVPEEVEANHFAAELLMPEDAVRFVFENEGISSINGLAARFHVSEVAMRLRLKNLGYL